MKSIHRHINGFTLVELAVVLIILSLLIGSVMMPMSAQQESQKVAATEAALGEIRNALLGYALAHDGKLPCPMPTTVTSPDAAEYGMPATTCSNTPGLLPWKALGVSEVDAWGSKRTQAGEAFFGYWKYQVHSAFTEVYGFSTSPATPVEFSVYNHVGQKLHGSAPGGEPPVAIVYSTGPNGVSDGRNANADPNDYESGERTPSFDDQLIWIARPALFSRLAAAGILKN